MKWSLLVGKFWGTEIRLHTSLLLLIPYALVTFRPSNLGDTLRVFLLVTAIFACVALHEMGHTLAARLYGIQVNSIVLWPLGGFANLSRRPEKVFPDLVISAAGPLTNLVLFAGLLALTILEQVAEDFLLPPGLSRLLRASGAFPFLAGLALANLSLALFNLVPVFPLDGGQIARNLLKLVFGERHADTILLVISMPLALALLVVGFVAGDVVVILTGLLLVLAGSSLNPRLTHALSLGVLYFIDRGGYYLKRQDYDPAIREFTNAIQRTPNRPGLYVSRAVAYMSLMECERARADIERALALEQNNFVAWTLRGELLALDGQHEAALASFNRSIEIRPQWAVPYLDRGSLYQEQGDTTRALAEMNKAVELGQNTPISCLLRSILRYQMGDKDGASSDANQALRYAPHWMLVFPEIFLSNFKGHQEWALEYYWRAIERTPHAHQPYQGRADACRVNGRPDWAVLDYNRAIERAPSLAELYLARGRCYLEMEALEWAAADFRQAARLADRAHIRRQAETLLSRFASGPTGAPQPDPFPVPAGSAGQPASSPPALPPADAPPLE